MTLQRLLAASFLMGCGVSMERALLTPRYQELHIKHLSEKYGNTTEFAQIELLGEMLADRAAKNLPIKVRNVMPKWQEGIEAQHVVLDTLMHCMTSTVWRGYGNRKQQRKRYGTLSAVFPAATKSWERGPVQPNCLGVAQMLVGFARSVGARHYLVTILKNDAMRIDEEALLAIAAAEKRLYSLKDVPEVKRLLRDLHKERIKVLEHMDKLQREMAHHALLIQLADESWRIVDPYFSINHSLGRKYKDVLRYLDRIDSKGLGFNLWIPFNAGAITHLHKAAKLLASINFIKNYSAKVNRRKSFDKEAIDVMAYSIAQFCLNLTEEEYTNFNLDTATKAQKDTFLRIYGVLTDYAYVPQRVRAYYIQQIKKGREGIVKNEYDSFIQLTQGNRERYKRAQWRLLRGACQLMIEEFWVMAGNSNARTHELLDVAHPTISLACATLNHQRVKTGTHIHGRLALYSSGQWIVHDTLAAAEHGDIIDAPSQKAINRHIKRIRKNGPKHSLDPLKPLLIER